MKIKRYSAGIYVILQSMSSNSSCPHKSLGKAEMQIQDQQLLLSLRHLQSLLEELQAESTHWEDTRSSRNTSPFRARLGSEGRGCQPVLGEVVQLLQGEESRRSSLP
nr:uncharacterized protein C20orf202 homolog isoform X1 [Peromyscus maniculatus bairdii]